ncbi:MAG: hypothetical protein J0H31_03300, partial [Alphaproteobacteria bacterium]|nr:hypothetical protein [Alphaproteobacteria bacterium]
MSGKDQGGSGQEQHHENDLPEGQFIDVTECQDTQDRSRKHRRRADSEIDGNLGRKALLPKQESDREDLHDGNERLHKSTLPALG